MCIASSLVLPRPPYATGECTVGVAVDWRQVAMFKLALRVGAMYPFPTPSVAFWGGIIVNLFALDRVFIFFSLPLPAFPIHVPNKSLRGFILVCQQK